MSKKVHDITEWITIEDSPYSQTCFCSYGSFGLIKVLEGYNDVTGVFDLMSIVRVDKADCHQILTNMENK